MYFLIVLVFIGAAAFLILRQQSDFSLTVKNGEVVKVRGKISQKLRSELESGLDQVKDGKVLGQYGTTGIRLSFQGDIGDFTQQRLRNIAGLH